MKKSLSIGTIVLGCCLAAVAQMGSTPNQTPPAGSTPSTFPQDQTGQAPGNPSTPAGPSALPPDTPASSQIAPDQGSGSQTSVLGCLSRGADGSFMLADSTGNSFLLRGLSAQLGDFVGNQVRVEGTAVSSPPGAMSSSGSTDSSSASPSDVNAKQLNVSSVHKVSDSCAAKH